MPNGMGYDTTNHSEELDMLRREKRMRKTLDILGWITWAVVWFSIGAFLSVLSTLCGR